MKKKLIEVALPLEAINKEAAREKSIRHGHPSTLHLWWARRPLAACRAVLFSSLVDDPSSHPEQFPTEEDQEKERQRLFRLIERLVKWENIGDEALYKEAYEEILKSTDGNPPPVLDPFAGGGSIPLEAQRLGLEAHASDLNPVAVLINKALIEIPPRFKDQLPINPESRKKLLNPISYKGAKGLAEDVKYYGEWMKEQAFARVGHLYPKAKLQDGSEVTVIAWIWARTVKCSNPVCGAEMPLVSSYWLCKKKGREAWIEPIIDNDRKTVEFQVKTGEGVPQAPPKVARGAKFRCLVCEQISQDQHIKIEAQNNRMGTKLLAIIADGSRGRVYLSPANNHIEASVVDKPADCFSEKLGYDPRNIWCVNYGLREYRDLFSPRQLTTLVTFSDLITDAIKKIHIDSVAAGFLNDNLGLDANGYGAKAYSEAVGVYLACAVDRSVNYWSTLTPWGGDFIVQTFGRQALPMVWDFAEGNPLSDSTGNWMGAIEWICLAIRNLPARGIGTATQKDAMTNTIKKGLVISTDPPYYDNIGYADLSDYFYVWLRRSMKLIYPELFQTMLVPKVEELIVNPYRFDGNKNASNDFYMAGMQDAFTRMRETVLSDYPLTVYYGIMIMPGSIPLGKPAIREELTRYLSSGWDSIIEQEIDGTRSKARSLDSKGTHYGKYNACSRVTRTVFLGSAPDSREQRNRGLSAANIRLGVMQPGEFVSTYNDASAKLTNELTYLYFSNNRYWFDTRPTLRKTVTDRALMQKPEDIYYELEKLIKNICKGKEPFEAVHIAPKSSGDVQDQPTVRLVLLAPMETHKKDDTDSKAMLVARDMLGMRGGAPRMYRNMLLLLAPDVDAINHVVQDMRQYMAWCSIDKDAEVLKLDNAQKRETKDSIKRLDDTIKDRIQDAYGWLLLPTQESTSAVEWDAIRVAGPDNPITKVTRQSKADELLVEALSPKILLMEMEKYNLWKDRESMPIRELWEDYTRYLYLHRLTNYDVLRKSLESGVMSGEYFAYADGIDGDGRYQGLCCGSTAYLHITTDGLLVKSDAAKRQIEKENIERKTINIASITDDEDNCNNNTNYSNAIDGESPAPISSRSAKKNTHFFGSVRIDSNKLGSTAGQINQEVLQHINKLSGVEVMVTLDIQVKIPDGIPDDIARTIRENCRTLRFENSEFDDE